MNPAIERRLLQGVILFGGVVPVAGGLSGVIHGLGASAMPPDSHARYLSGLLLGIGLAFWASVPTIERRGEWVRLLGAIVILGGLARLAAAPVTGLGMSVSLPLVMELIVTPALVLWRERVEARLRVSSKAAKEAGGCR